MKRALRKIYRWLEKGDRRSRPSLGCARESRSSSLGYQLGPVWPITHEKFIFTDHIRTCKKESEEASDETMTLAKILTERKRRSFPVKSTLGSRQKKIKTAVENMLRERRVKLHSAGRQIRARGMLLVEDIRETKNRMKEKIENAIERENFYTIPNMLCVSRIAFSPLLGYFIVSHHYGYALIFMAVAGMSDWVDGYIARNYPTQSSKIGSFLDPMADKVLIGTLFLCLTHVDLVPVPLTVLVVARDVVLVAAGFVIRYRSLPPPRTLARYFDVTLPTAQLAPTFISKVNTAVQLALVASTLAAPVFGFVDHPLLHGLWYATAVSTVLAAASYLSCKETYRYINSKKPSKWKEQQ